MRLTQSILIAFALLLGTTSASWSVDYYGAIAFSQNTGATGWAYDYRSRRAAENTALNNCYKHAGDCRVTIWFRNACGALAVTNRNGWGSAWGYNRSNAENKALNACYKRNNGCYIKRWVCTAR